MQSQELVQAVQDLFGGRTAIPAVVAHWPAGVEQTARHTLSNVDPDPKRLYLFGSSTRVELLAPAGAREEVSLSYWGHGMNSYAWTLHHRRPGLRFLAQVPYGGALARPGDDAAQAALLWGLYDEAVRTADVVQEGDVVVCASSLRRLSAVLVTDGHVEREDLRAAADGGPREALRRLRG